MKKPTRNKPRITAAQINDCNEEFWAIEALRARANANPHLGDQERVVLLEHGPQNIHKQITERRQQQELALEGDRTQARRAKGTTTSAARRRADNLARDRRIHDAYHQQGLAPKVIAGRKTIVGKKSLSASRIRSILKEKPP